MRLENRPITHGYNLRATRIKNTSSRTMDGFEIRVLPGKGRSLVATKPFKIGDTIFEEEPLVSCQFSWNKLYGYVACDHCIRPLETAEKNVQRLANDVTVTLPFPECCPTKDWIEQMTACLQCDAKYCSEDCRREALMKYHKIACMGSFKSDDSHPINILNEVWKNIHYPPETGTIMIVVKILAMYKQSPNKEEFLETINSFQSIGVNEDLMIFHKMLGPNFEGQIAELYVAFRNAFGCEEFQKFVTPDAFKSLMLLIGTNSQGIATSPYAEWVRRVGETDLTGEQKVQLDTYIDELYHKLSEFAGEFLNSEGSGLYQLQSKINHSCVPNAQSSFPYSNDILVLKALVDISPDQEVCISYLDDCQLERSRHSRQKELKDNYLFICKCVKCERQLTDPDETSEDEEDSENDVDMD